MFIQVEERIKSLLKNKLEKYNDWKAIVAIKGLPLALIKDVIGVAFIEEEFIKEGLIDFEGLSSKEGKKLLLQQMMMSGNCHILCISQLDRNK